MTDQEQRNRLNAAHEAPANKPTTHTHIAKWAEENNVELGSISHILNGVVDDIVSLDTLVQGIPLEQKDQEKPEPHVVVPPGAFSAHTQQQLREDIGVPYEETVSSTGYPALVSYVQSLQQASRNLRTKVQVLRVGPVRG